MGPTTDCQPSEPTMISTAALLFDPTTLFLTYLAAELFFLLAFHLYLLPRANRIRSYVEQYHDYGNSRSKLLERILDRIEDRCKRDGTTPLLLPRIEEFLGDWFCVCGDVGDIEKRQESDAADRSLRETSASSSSSDDEWQTIDRTAATENSRSTPFLRRGDTDIFFSWAFFGKPYDGLLQWEQDELQRIYGIILKRTGMKFDQPGTTPGVKPMRLTLDDVRATYRPFIVYAIFATLNLVAAMVLYCCGFRRHRSRSGLTYWHRDATSASEDSRSGTESSNAMPLLFNHGIAPGGLALYLPMILWGFGPLGGGSDKDLDRDGGCGRSDRPMILFENHPISFYPCFDAVDEEAFIAGVQEAMDTCLGRERLSETGVAIMGHSFGSCQITWMLRCKDIRRNVRQVVLLDPVSILLSEPDVVTNFLYAGREAMGEPTVSFLGALRPIALFPLYYVLDLLRPASRSRGVVNRAASTRGASFRSYSSFSAGKPEVGGRNNKIWMVQSELWIEHYLRRNFAWYNSELWLEDIPPHIKVIIGISGNDEILNPSKVHAEAIRYEEKSDNVEIIYWPGAGHAYAVPRPWTWSQIRTAMREGKQFGTTKKA